MKLLDTIFKSTYYFWVITRLVLLLLFGSTITYYANEELDAGSIIVGVFILGFVISLLIIVIRKLMKKDTKPFLHIYNGVFAIIFSLGIIYVSIAYFDLSRGWWVLYLPVWILLYGLWELTYESKKRGLVSSDS
ncbi:hypothetical protein NE848_04535 [Gramella jeungdoensis]|uniref:Uncharacterized protein n=1 Tax=Gramella jeungdoensis TaxID=708091 RepID=A0ABT0YZR1_9FLAO|nr:hypothetical protein [Gramella jeungdoensis]MCM8568633.1 hypothetical protein [Gramella jeungdoensis]